MYKDAEKSYGSELLNLVVAKGYLTKLVANEAVRSWLDRNTPEFLEQFELVINTARMEEAMEQQARHGTDEPDAAAEPTAPQDEASGGLAAE
ncbi:plasmid partitioning protein RepB C-terminal domain-containing protein [Aquicoccus porphyridii]|uniref:plasmid partitioning protein RepB C-terminal domain-containing protein n=1 Tax=Aquicoccus porphyridii TaxID=1852029 RepID=UPI002482434B|nr:plasmid partitioning protein RepB C-terminal domain-containing protein [Aquicoccus porphyridii]